MSESAFPKPLQAIRRYCWCPEALRLLAEEIGVRANPRPYRSPDLRKRAWLASRAGGGASRAKPGAQ